MFQSRIGLSTLDDTKGLQHHCPVGHIHPHIHLLGIAIMILISLVVSFCNTWLYTPHTTSPTSSPSTSPTHSTSPLVVLGPGRDVEGEEASIPCIPPSIPVGTAFPASPPSPELIMSGLGIRDVVVELHEHPRTYSKAPMEFWEPGKRRPCFVNDPVGNECPGPKIISQDAPVEFVVTRNLLLRSATFF